MTLVTFLAAQSACLAHGTRRGYVKWLIGPFLSIWTVTGAKAMIVALGSSCSGKLNILLTQLSDHLHDQPFRILLIVHAPLSLSYFLGS